MKYFVTYKSYGTFGQTGAGFHTSENSSLVGVYEDVKEAAMAAFEELPHGNHRWYLYEKSGRGVSESDKDSGSYLDAKALLEKGEGSFLAAAKRLGDPDVTLTLGHGSTSNVVISTTPPVEGNFTSLDPVNLAYQRLLLRG